MTDSQSKTPNPGDGAPMIATHSDSASSIHARDFIICGWFTPDYRGWWNRLRQNLNEIGAPHDFVERHKVDGGWEVNTIRKPHEILAAMDRHPNATIIFLDVDCSVLGNLDDLRALADVPGDIAFFMQSRWREKNTHSILAARSGTLVIQPTSKAREFVEVWRDAGREAPRFAVDQDTMVFAVGRVPGLVITSLEGRFCAIPRDGCDAPIILHDKASKGAHTNKWVRRLHRLKRHIAG